MSSRKPKDFANGKIYQLVNDVDNLVYVGHTTTTLPRRFYKHKMAAKEQPDRKVYKHINSLGIAHFRLELIEPWACQNEDELVAREGFWIRAMDSYKNGLNSCIAGRKPKESMKAHVDAHKTEIAQRMKAYYNAHKAKIADYKKAYRIANKAKIAEYNKNYRAAQKALKAQQILNETTETALSSNTTDAS